MAPDDWRAVRRPPLEPHMAHVWRVPLDDVSQLEAYLPTLSAEEQARADRFFRDVHRRRFVIAHGALRRILADYLDVMPGVLEFVTGEHGKPALTPIAGPQPAAVEFNLSHSGDLALVAVTRANPVGVDVEQWDEGVECMELAERFFSPNERRALRALAKAPNHVVAGFFAAWTRKEAYLKATGSISTEHARCSKKSGLPATSPRSCSLRRLRSMARHFPHRSVTNSSSPGMTSR